MQKPLTERERITRTLRGEEVDVLPWATRLDIWHMASIRSGTLPADMVDVPLMALHRRFGIGRQSYSRLTKLKLNRVDLQITFNGEVIHEESNPVMHFPLPADLVPLDGPGDTVMTFKSPAGRAKLRFRTNEILIREAAAPYLMEHVLKGDGDFSVVQWIVDHAEPVADYAEFEAREAEIGDDGFTIGTLVRVPFQQVMLDYMGEESAVYAMMDSRRDVERLLSALGEQTRRVFDLGLESPAFMLEFTDNFEGSITSPRLFREHCIPFMQEIADRVHAAGRVLGSHMDGNMKPLLNLVPECGIDVVESFSPSPLTQLTFEEAWAAWKGKVLMWGVIPSPIFEPHVPESDFVAWMEDMMRLLDGDQRIILGIGDQALRPTITERIQRVSEMLGRTLP